MEENIQGDGKTQGENEQVGPQKFSRRANKNAQDLCTQTDAHTKMYL